MVFAQPEYSQQHSIGPPSSAYQNINYSSSTTTNSPHSAPLQYDSPNPNPQLGHVHLDFIPLPTNQPSAPPQPPTSIPAEARYQTVPLPYVAPPPPRPSVPYPVPPSTDTRQPYYGNDAFADAPPIDMSKEKHKLSPAAGGSTVLEDLRNPRKKIFWIFNIIVLAIIFGVLGATVWKPDSNEIGEGRSHSPTPKPSAIPRTSPVVATPVTAPVPSPVTARVGTTSVTAPVVPTPVVVPTRVTAPPPPPPPPRPSPPPKPTGGGSGGGGGGGVDMSCEWSCGNVAEKCENNCRATDSSYKSCTAKCVGQDFCDFDCESSNGCLGGCMNTWSNCTHACG